MPSRDQVIDAIFHAMTDHARPALIALRDVADDEAVEKWAHEQSLNVPAIVDFAQNLRRWWARNPRAMDALLCGWRVSLTAVYVETSDEERKYRASSRWPEPQIEHLTAWRKRADAIYQELNRLRGYKLRPQDILMESDPDGLTRARLDDDTLTRHATWFVLYQVARPRLEVAEIVTRSPFVIDESTVRKGIAKVRRSTSLPDRN
jgi:hypothetical protein